VTLLASPSGAGGAGGPEGHAMPRESSAARSLRTSRPRRPAWPLDALLLLFPLWWVLGLGTLIFPLLAVPMALQLRRRPRVTAPPGFGIWLLFLVSIVVSWTLLGTDPEGTLAGTIVGRLPTVALAAVEYLAVTVVLLYAYNLTEREYPQYRLVRSLGVLFLVTVLGGYLGLVAPTLQLTSPVELLLPDWVRSNLYVRSLVHPAAAQLQAVFGYSTPRPAAPFGYTNTWGNNLSVLLPWFVVGFVVWRKARHRVIAGLVVAFAIVPAIYSLNRGLWIGLAISAVYVAVRTAWHGRLAASGLLCIAVMLALLVATATPLTTVFSQRLDNGQSDRVRAFTTEQTLRVAAQSPVLGFGSTRSAVGSAQSIAVGKSQLCQRCGNPTLGSNGQIWAVLMGQGYTGVLLYSGFFLYGIARFRRDRTPIGYAGVLVLMLALISMFYYNALVSPLCFYLLAYALLARNERLRQQAGTVGAGTGAGDGS